MSYFPLYPLQLKPALHAKVWGGRRLQTVLGIALPSSEPFGEAWIMHDTATVANGPLRGQTVAELLRAYGRDLLGSSGDPAYGMPLLAKFLDAREWLSIQVHPNDQQAAALDGETRGKTEAWYVIASEPGSTLVFGVQPGHTAAELADAIAQNTVEAMLNTVEVVAGDVIFVTPGTIHALGPGILIYEIQQSSDLTYRLYDYGRPRELHVEKGLTVSRLDSVPQVTHTANDMSNLVPIANSDYFETVMHQLRVGDYAYLDTRKTRFHIVSCIEGDAVLEWGGGSESRGDRLAVTSGDALDLKRGQTILIPASVGAYRLRGQARILRSYQP